MVKYFIHLFSKDGCRPFDQGYLAPGAKEGAVKISINVIALASRKRLESALLEGLETFGACGGFGAARNIGDDTVVADQVGAVGERQAATMAAGRFRRA